MRIVVDGLPIRGTNSLSIVSEHMLSGWRELGMRDEVHVVVRSDLRMTIPDGVIVHRVRVGRFPLLSRLYAQSVRLPHICRQVRPDVMLGVIPSTAITPLPCPRVVIAWDFRCRALPEQFRATTRWFRRVSYAVGFRQADGVVCISERTKADLRVYHGLQTADGPVVVASLGADHVDDWPPPVRCSGPGPGRGSGSVPGPGSAPGLSAGHEYAIAFGHFVNKNIDLVLHSWAAMQRQRQDMTLPLQLVGVGEKHRPQVEAEVARLGLAGVVTVREWLDDDAYRELFSSSSLVVLPSDYEGFGLPAVEAMRLGIPVVVTPEPALLEVTAGHAIVVEGEGPAALARAITTARHMPSEARESARRHARSFTWAAFANGVRTTLEEVSAAAGRHGHRPDGAADVRPRHHDPDWHAVGDRLDGGAPRVHDLEHGGPAADHVVWGLGERSWREKRTRQPHIPEPPEKRSFR